MERGRIWTERWMKEIVGPIVKKGEEIVKEGVYADVDTVQNIYVGISGKDKGRGGRERYDSA